MNRTGNKFLACFKPAVDDEDQPRFYSAPPSPEPDDKRKAARRSFSRAIDVVFFRTSLVKKIQSRRSSRQDSSSDLSPTKHKKHIKKSSSYNRLSSSDPEQIFRTNSNHSSLFSSQSPSSASSISSNSRNGSENDLKEMNGMNRQQQHAMKRDVTKRTVYYRSTSSGLLCIILICLVALVFWGKAMAIVACTTTWLFFAPRGSRSRGVVRVNDDVDSEEYKKRVIMGGLLERNRPRLL